MSPSGLKFRSQKEYLESDFNEVEDRVFEEEKENLQKEIESIPESKSVWPESIVEIYNCN